MPGTVTCSARREQVRRRPAVIATLVAAALAAASGSAAADANGGIVIGSIALAPPERRGPVPVRNQGFVRRVPALKTPRAVDPLKYIVVVLDGATPPEEDRQPAGQPVRYTIIGESFEAPILPVVTGSVVEIRNAGRGAPRLYSPGQPDLVPADPIGPRGERKTRKIEPAHRAFELRDRESVHLSGLIVAFPHRYTARVAPDGKFEIRDVAPGIWKVRVWYRDGWAEAAEETVEVVAKKESKPVKLTLPAKLVTRPAR
ncbi:MAG TPA: hypothetical protein VNO33_03555 [Kofleriaceae bacterium]|nr:hypothetical protein [Kofleriaceae bacterium]